MRWPIALLGALWLAGCAASERVTLLAPAQSDKDIGAVFVEHSNEAGGTLVDKENQQARLRGQERAPDLTTLEETDPRHADVVGNFPPAVFSIPVPFLEVGKMTLTPEQIEQVKQDIMRAVEGHPAPQIEVVGHASMDGSTGRNQHVSYQRAQFVAGILKELGFEIEEADILWQGESLQIAQVAEGKIYPAESYRRVDVIIR